MTLAETSSNGGEAMEIPDILSVVLEDRGDLADGTDQTSVES